ncbi:MAG: AsmA family protein [Proteobacteria bacterium]|nr:AsmA family protein [Pseudomonadota bacterium]
MRKLLFGILIVVVSIVAVVLISPSLIDWNDYRDEIADQIRKATGRDFVIDGDVDFQLLPAPTLTVGNSKLANLKGAVAPDLVRLKSFELRIQFWPLLSRRIVIESMVLRDPVIELEVLADGRRNWRFGEATATGGRASTEGASGAGVMGAVRLDSLTIYNATLIYRDRASGTVERIEGLNAEIAAQTLYGPLRVKGDFSYKGIRLGFEADAGKIAAGESTPVSLRLNFPAAKAETRISGTFSVKAGGPEVRAKLRSQGPNLGRFAALLMSPGVPSPQLPGFLARPFTLESTLAYSAKGIEINDIALQLGETRAAGGLNIQLGKVLRIDAALSFNRIDLDRWLASGMVTYGAGGAAGDGTPSPDDAKAPGDADGGTPLAVSLPKGVSASIDISVEAMAYRGGVIRQAKLNASLANGELTLHQFSAFLPGGSDISLTGVLTAKRDKPRFTGAIEAVSDNFRGLLSWLKVDAASLPAGRLHKLSLAAKLGATEERLEVRDFDLRFDSSRVTGGIIFALRSRLAFGANIAIDRLNLDAYLPAPARTRSPDGKPAGAGAGAVKEEGAPGSAVLAMIEDFDANLKARIGELTYNHVPLKDIRFDGTLLAGKVKVRGASIGEVAGGRVALSGSLVGNSGDIAKAPEVNLVFDVTASDPVRLSQLAGIDLPVSPEQLGLVAFSGRVEGTLKRLNIDATFKADKATLAVKGSIGDLETAPRYAIEVNVRHPSFTRLVRIFDPGFKPAARELGGFRLKAGIKNDGPVYKFSDISGKLGPVKLAGNAVLRVGGARPKLTAELAMSEIIADMFLPVPAPAKSAAKASPAPGDGAPGAAAERWSREPIDFSPLELIDADVRLKTPALNYREFRAENARMDVKLVNGVLDIERLDGTVFGGAFALKGRISAAEKAPGQAPGQANVSIEVTGVDIHRLLGDLAGIDAAEGRANVTMSLTSAGRSSFELVSALAGKGRIEVTDGAVKGINLGRINARLKRLNQPTDLFSLVQTAMSGGKTKFTTMKGTFTIAKGVVTTRDMHMVAEGGEGRAAGIADLPGWLVDLAAEFRLTDHPKAPPFEMQLKGPLDNPRRIFKANKLQAYLMQRGVGSMLEKFLPRRRSAAPPAPTAAPAPRTEPAPRPKPPPSPEDFIRGILKGLGG